MRSEAGSMSTLSIIRAAILAPVAGARPFAGSSIFQKLGAGVSSFGQGCLHPLKRHRIALPQIDPPAVTGKQQGLWQGRDGFTPRSSGSQQPLTLPRLSGGAGRLVASRWGHGASSRRT
jgi:hypothetical protein